MWAFFLEDRGYAWVTFPVDSIVTIYVFHDPTGSGAARVVEDV